MNKSSKKILGTCSGILIVAAMIVAGYFLLNKQVQKEAQENVLPTTEVCLLYTSPSPRDRSVSRMPSSA